MVGGDKSEDWRGWYDRNIPIADDRFDEHQAQLAAEAGAAGGKKKTATKKGRGGR